MIKRVFHLFLTLTLGFTFSGCEGLFSFFDGSGTALSRSQGLQNLGNTCFANSVHKLLWSHPHILAATAPHSILNPLPWNPSSTRHSTETEELSARTQLQSSMHTLMNDLTQSQNTGNPSQSYHRSALDSVFDHLEASLRATQGRVTLNSTDRLRVHQSDAREYLAILSNLLDLSHPDRLSGFMIHDQTDRMIHEGLTLEVRADSHSSASITDQIQDYLHTLPLDATSVPPGRLTLPEGRVPPTALILAIDRVLLDPLTASPTGVRSTQSITLPENIPLVFESLNPVSPRVEIQEYFPKAVVIQHGNVGSGHYYAYVYQPTERAWYKHNDRVVTRVEPSDLPAAISDMEQYSVLVLISTL